MKHKIPVFGVAMLAFLAGVTASFVLAREQLKRVGGASSEATTALAWQALEKNRYEVAENLAFDALEADPDSYVPLAQLGEVYARRGEYSAARSAYGRALTKLDGSGGNFSVKRLDSTLRESERRILREKLAQLESSVSSMNAEVK